MKQSLRIALAAAVLASVAPVLLASPTNPWPVPVPQSAMSSPTNPWPVPVPQSAMSSPTNPWPVPVPQAHLAL
jgi:hypothetical protein